MGRALPRSTSTSKQSNKRKQVILTNDTVHRDPQGMVSGFTRQNYVAIYNIDDISFHPNTGLKFTITGRVSDLQ